MQNLILTQTQIEMLKTMIEAYEKGSNVHLTFGIAAGKTTVMKIFNDGDSFGKPKCYFYITGQEKEYTDLQILCNDWNEIKNYDDPNSEIQWIKIIKSKTIK